MKLNPQNSKVRSFSVKGALFVLCVSYLAMYLEKHLKVSMIGFTEHRNVSVNRPTKSNGMSLLNWSQGTHGV